MSVPESAVQQPRNIRLWVRVGAINGLQIGGRVALIYLFTVLIVIWLFTLLIGEFNTNVFVYLLMALGIGLVLGVIPALLIGSLSGALIGLLSAQPFMESYWKRLILAGVGTASLVIAILSSLLLPVIKDTFPLFIGLPSPF